MKFLVLFIVFCIINRMICTDIKVTKKVYFDIQIGGKNHGTVVIGLFGEIAPKTVKNFMTIATKGINGKTFAGTKIHRVIKRFMIQGGDIVNGDGTGSISIYGDNFPDENFHINHSAPGFVSMANFGPHTNGCQFFITTMETPWLNGRHVVFGKVVEGQDIIHVIEHLKTHYNDTPKMDVLITKSGRIAVKKPFYVSEHPYTTDAYIKAIVPPLLFSLFILGIFQWFIRKLDMCS